MDANDGIISIKAQAMEAISMQTEWGNGEVEPKVVENKWNAEISIPYGAHVLKWR